ncbi:MAG: polysaccharide biosynthesis protein, partial [Pseudomonadota bacterium]|nr:polysaccharide biosynthesis protein [Pseudomonadota bacterium]
MTAANPPGCAAFWRKVDGLLARLRPHRQVLTLTVDAGVVAVCWQITYLFRLGFERWLTTRPSYDNAVLLGVVLVYTATSLLLRVPQSMWRFSGFGEIQRLMLCCLLAGTFSALAVMGLGLVQVPRAVLALHPVVTLMGLAIARIVYRMTYEHARARISGSQGVVRRAIVLGAGAAARLLMAGLYQQGWVVLAVLDDDPAKLGARVG